MKLSLTAILAITLYTAGLSQKTTLFDNTKYKDDGYFDESGNKSGQWIEYHTDSLLHLNKKQLVIFQDSGRYLANKKDGTWKSYYMPKNDNTFTWLLLNETPYIENQVDGVQTNYNLDKSFFTQEFSDGNKNGKQKHYQKNNILNFELNYSNGKKSGDLIQYFENGNIKTVIPFTNDKKNGITKKYYQNGQLAESGNTKDGMYTGEYKWYYNNGVLRKLGTFTNGKRSGDWTTFYPSRERESSYSYNDGEVNGIWRYYHKNGNLCSEILYFKGLMWEVLANFDKNGKERPKGTLVNGTGTLNLYSTTGELTETLTIENGIEISKK